MADFRTHIICTALSLRKLNSNYHGSQCNWSQPYGHTIVVPAPPNIGLSKILSVVMKHLDS